MHSYQYLPLADTENGIRLLFLKPGHFDDQLKAEIHEATMLVPEKRSVVTGQLSLTELEATLPSGWTVGKTIEGRCVFTQSDDLGMVLGSSWTHPDPAFSSDLYETSIVYPDSNEPHYEALSYTWGTDPSSTFLQIDATSSAEYTFPASRLALRQNLHDALTYLRRTDKPRSLWIDAISINQEDDTEKNRQVGRMDDIYRYAYGVIVWLGFPSPNSQLAMRTIEYLGTQIQLGERFSSAYPTPHTTEPQWFLSSTRLPYDDATWSSIGELLERPWFSRRWIVQEIQLANIRAVIQCGHEQMSWVKFRTACLNFYFNQHLPQRLRKPIASVFSLCNDFRDTTFPNLLFGLRFAMCTDKRDMIYALLGLMPTKLREEIHPQYSRSAEEVFRSAFLACLEFTERLELFELCYLSNRVMSGPTWVPDLVASTPVRGNMRFQFSSGFSQTQVVQASPETLQVYGVLSDTVDIVCPPYTAGNGLSGLLAFLEAHLPVIRTHTIESRFWDDLIRTCCVDRTVERYPESELPSLGTWKAYFLAMGEGQPFNLSQSDGASLQLELDHTLMRLTDRTFFALSNGAIGLGPPGMQNGDVASVLLGCASPMILRPISDDAFKVVGECFIAHLTDSIAILGPLPDLWAVHHFSSAGFYRAYYVDTATGSKTLEDPRLDTLDGWEVLDNVPADQTTNLVAKFRNTTTGELLNSDPRLAYSQLQSRGIKLDLIRLV